MWFDNNLNAVFNPFIDSVYYDIGLASLEIDSGDILISGPGAPNGTLYTGSASAVNIGFVDKDSDLRWSGKALRPFGFLWYPTTYTPILGTDFYLTVISDASGSRLLDRYYAIVARDANQGLHLFIDPDTTFEIPAPTNNTKSWGPFSLGDTLSDWTIVIGGRNFVLNFVDMDNSEFLNADDLLVLVEVLQASCCGNEIVYDISVQSDAEPSYWREGVPKNPLLAARLSKGTGTDILTPISQQIEWSVAHRIGTTVFHNIKLTNREYIDLEIWFDDGYDIINNGYLLISHNTKDDYIPLTQAEEWLGVVDDNYGDITSQGQVIKELTYLEEHYISLIQIRMEL